MKAGLYIRVSTEEQAKKGYSIPEQIDADWKKAQELGATEYELFIEEGESGAYLDRPELERIIAAVQSGDIKLVVAVDTDRLARDLGDQIVIANEIEKYAKLDFVYYSRGNPDNPEDNLFFHIKGAFAQYERAKIKRNTSLGRKRKAMSGKIVIPGGWTGHPGPYGYKYYKENDKENNGPRLEIIESEAEVVRYIFDLAFTEGYGILRIVECLNQENIPSPKGGYWHGSTVGRILKNETYAGVFYNYKYRVQMTNKRTSGGKRQILHELRPLEERIPVTVPAIIERRIWEVVQNNLKRNFLKNRKTGSFFLLKGRVKCGLCGRTCAAETSGPVSLKSETRRTYYRCKGTKTGAYPKCTLPTIASNTTSKRHGLDDVVWAEIVRFFNNPELIQKSLNEADKTASINKINSQIKKLNTKTSDLSKQKDELFNLRLEGLLSAGELKKRLTKLETKKREIEIQLDELQNTLATIESTRINPVEFCEYFQKRIQHPSDETKVQVVHDDLDIKIIAYPNNYIIRWPFADITIKTSLIPEPFTGVKPLSMTPEIKEALQRYCERESIEISPAIRMAIREAPLNSPTPKIDRQKRHRRTINLTNSELEKVVQIEEAYHLSPAYAIEWAIEIFLINKGLL